MTTALTDAMGACQLQPLHAVHNMKILCNDRARQQRLGPSLNTAGVGERVIEKSANDDFKSFATKPSGDIPYHASNWPKQFVLAV